MDMQAHTLTADMLVMLVDTQARTLTEATDTQPHMPTEDIPHTGKQPKLLKMVSHLQFRISSRHLSIFTYSFLHRL
jgi:hypothetical protein